MECLEDWKKLHYISIMNDTISLFRKEICNETGAGGTIMCPRCEVHCPYEKLHDSCRLSYVTYLTDNYATIAFSVMMAFWGK